MDPGIYDGIPADDYHSGPGISVSTLKDLAEEGGPARVRYGEREETEALRLGTLIHMAVLEPHRLEQVYQPTDLERRGTNAWRDAEQAAMGRELVKRYEYDAAREIADAIMRQSSVARELINGQGQREQSWYAFDRETGLLRRGRVDLLHRPFEVILDVKSCESATYADFRDTMWRYRYAWQDAYYRDGITDAPGGFEPAAFIFLAVEKRRPFLCATYEIDPDDVVEGRDACRAQLRRIAECIEKDEWPGLPDGLQRLKIRRAAATI